MDVLLDHLAATAAMLGLAVVLTVANLARPGADAPTPSADADRVQAVLAAVEADLLRAVALDATTDTEGSFSFTSHVDPDHPDGQAVTYRLAPAAADPSVRVIERWVDGARRNVSAPVETWGVQALDATGAEASRVEDATRVRVRIAGRHGGRPQRWEATVAPPALGPAGR